MMYVALWARAFAVTCAVELLIATRLLPRTQTLARRIAAVLVAQCCTHPAVWFVWPELLHRRMLFLLVAEAWALFAETGVYRLVFPSLSWRRCLAVSALANAASYLTGLIFFK